MANTRYTPELLAPLVKASVSYSEVLRKLGKRWSGGLQNHLVARIAHFGLDTSHFLGQAANRGPRHKGGPARRAWQAILVTRKSGRREKTGTLRRALLEAGVEEVCATCQLGPVWNDMKLTLQINHRNGDNIDDCLANLEFLCPNCHTQTVTFGAKKR